ncbi:MAG: hypothetical protein HOQ05_11115 [Corynebacteriales bacterium]|nr:hypothetical protein [Mycobacteriales bacterium]
MRDDPLDALITSSGNGAPSAVGEVNDDSTPAPDDEDASSPVDNAPESEGQSAPSEMDDPQSSSPASTADGGPGGPESPELPTAHDDEEPESVSGVRTVTVLLGGSHGTALVSHVHQPGRPIAEERRELVRQAEDALNRVEPQLAENATAAAIVADLRVSMADPELDPDAFVQQLADLGTAVFTSQQPTATAAQELVKHTTELGDAGTLAEAAADLLPATAHHLEHHRSHLDRLVDAMEGDLTPSQLEELSLTVNLVVNLAVAARAQTEAANKTDERMTSMVAYRQLSPALGKAVGVVDDLFDSRGRATRVDALALRESLRELSQDVSTATASMRNVVSPTASERQESRALAADLLAGIPEAGLLGPAVGELPPERRAQGPSIAWLEPSRRPPQDNNLLVDPGFLSDRDTFSLHTQFVLVPTAANPDEVRREFAAQLSQKMRVYESQKHLAQGRSVGRSGDAPTPVQMMSADGDEISMMPLPANPWLEDTANRNYLAVQAAWQILRDTDDSTRAVQEAVDLLTLHGRQMSEQVAEYVREHADVADPEDALWGAFDNQTNQALTSTERGALTPQELSGMLPALTAKLQISLREVREAIQKVALENEVHQAAFGGADAFGPEHLAPPSQFGPRSELTVRLYQLTARADELANFSTAEGYEELHHRTSEVVLHSRNALVQLLTSRKLAHVPPEALDAIETSMAQLSNARLANLPGPSLRELAFPQPDPADRTTRIPLVALEPYGGAPVVSDIAFSSGDSTLSHEEHYEQFRRVWPHVDRLLDRHIEAMHEIGEETEITKHKEAIRDLIFDNMSPGFKVLFLSQAFQETSRDIAAETLRFQPEAIDVIDHYLTEGNGRTPSPQIHPLLDQALARRASDFAEAARDQELKLRGLDSLVESDDSTSARAQLRESSLAAVQQAENLRRMARAGIDHIAQIDTEVGPEGQSTSMAEGDIERHELASYLHTLDRFGERLGERAGAICDLGEADSAEQWAHATGELRELQADLNRVLPFVEMVKEPFQLSTFPADFERTSLASTVGLREDLGFDPASIIAEQEGGPPEAPAPARGDVVSAPSDPHPPHVVRIPLFNLKLYADEEQGIGVAADLAIVEVDPANPQVMEKLAADLDQVREDLAVSSPPQQSQSASSLDEVFSPSGARVGDGSVSELVGAVARYQDSFAADLDSALGAVAAASESDEQSTEDRIRDVLTDLAVMARATSNELCASFEPGMIQAREVVGELAVEKFVDGTLSFPELCLLSEPFANTLNAKVREIRDLSADPNATPALESRLDSLHADLSSIVDRLPDSHEDVEPLKNRVVDSGTLRENVRFINHDDAGERALLRLAASTLRGSEVKVGAPDPIEDGSNEVAQVLDQLPSEGRIPLPEQPPMMTIVLPAVLNDALVAGQEVMDGQPTDLRDSRPMRRSAGGQTEAEDGADDEATDDPSNDEFKLDPLTWNATNSNAVQVDEALRERTQRLVTEGKGEQLIEGLARGVPVAAGIDRAVSTTLLAQAVTTYVDQMASELAANGIADNLPTRLVGVADSLLLVGSAWDSAGPAPFGSTSAALRMVAAAVRRQERAGVAPDEQLVSRLATALQAVAIRGEQSGAGLTLTEIERFYGGGDPGDSGASPLDPGPDYTPDGAPIDEGVSDGEVNNDATTNTNRPKDDGQNLGALEDGEMAVPASGTDPRGNFKTMSTHRQLAVFLARQSDGLAATSAPMGVNFEQQTESTPPSLASRERQRARARTARR